MANQSGRSFPSLRIPARWQEDERSLVRQIEDLFDRLFLGNYRIRPGSPLAKSVTNIVYPVGSIYSCDENTNPNKLFAGTWTLIAVTIGIENLWKRTE